MRLLLILLTAAVLTAGCEPAGLGDDCSTIPCTRGTVCQSTCPSGLVCAEYNALRKMGVCYIQCDRSKRATDPENVCPAQTLCDGLHGGCVPSSGPYSWSEVLKRKEQQE